MPPPQKIEVPPGVTPNSHMKVTMRNVVKWEAEGRGRYEIANEATDFVPNGDVDAYVADARVRWQEVLVTNVNAAVPPVYKP